MTSLLYLRFLVPVLYLSAAVAYTLLLTRRLKQTTWPTRLLLSGLLLHLVVIVLLGAEAGAAGGTPFVGISGFLSIFAFLVGLIYFLLEMRYKVCSLGAFYTAVVCVLQLVAACCKRPVTAVSPLNTGQLFVLHVVPAAVAYAAFTVSAVAAVAYLLLDRAIRKKQRGVLMRGLPNLDLVEAVNAAGAKIGLPLLVIAAIAGLLMGYQKLGDAYQWDPKNWVTYAIIAIYGTQLAVRRFAGFAGRRSVAISLIGFGAILCGITVIDLYFSKLHGGL